MSNAIEELADALHHAKNGRSWPERAAIIDSEVLVSGIRYALRREDLLGK